MYRRLTLNGDVIDDFDDIAFGDFIRVHLSDTGQDVRLELTTIIAPSPLVGLSMLFDEVLGKVCEGVDFLPLNILRLSLCFLLRQLVAPAINGGFNVPPARIDI